MKTLNEMKVTFLSSSVNESFSRMTISAFIAQLDPTIEELTDIKTAVSEAVTNCIVHGYKNKIGYIYITAKIYEGKKVWLKIRDRGCGIENVQLAMTPLYTSSPNEERSGLGFSVMESFMDKISVSSTPSKGTSVVMSKTISSKID